MRFPPDGIFPLRTAARAPASCVIGETLRKVFLRGDEPDRAEAADRRQRALRLSACMPANYDGKLNLNDQMIVIAITRCRAR